MANGVGRTVATIPAGSGAGGEWRHGIPFRCAAGCHRDRPAPVLLPRHHRDTDCMCSRGGAESRRTRTVGRRAFCGFCASIAPKAVEKLHTAIRILKLVRLLDASLTLTVPYKVGRAPRRER